MKAAIKKPCVVECRHSRRELCTEADGCYWLACLTCQARGPKRHSATLAIASAKNNMRKR